MEQPRTQIVSKGISIEEKSSYHQHLMTSRAKPKVRVIKKTRDSSKKSGSVYFAEFNPQSKNVDTIASNSIDGFQKDNDYGPLTQRDIVDPGLFDSLQSRQFGMDHVQFASVAASDGLQFESHRTQDGLAL